MTGSEPASIGLLLRRMRTKAALSQEALAERAGISARAVGDLERGFHHAPRLETVRLLADALRLDAHDRAALLAAARPEVTTAPTAHAPSPLPTAALPLPLTRLIGREQDVAALGRLLAQDEHRLVTLTGPGGTGKTRLALAIAAASGDRYRDGVWFVDLSPLSDADLVLPAIAAAFGVREAGGGLAARLVEVFGEKRLLIVLDNFEHVVEAAVVVADLLVRAPGLQVLATSRAPLHAYGEWEYPLLPLPVPDPARLPPPEVLSEYGSVRLFIERAQAVQPEFSLTSANAPVVAAICHRLDGLPLAIELAAARLKMLPPPALLTRLEKRLPLLTGGASTLPARQRTMRSTIAWSYDLLSPEEQTLFRRLAIFAGGFTLSAAEAMEDPDEEHVAFDGVAALVEHSLLRQTPGIGDEPRYLMLETVREFGLERLSAEGGEDETRQRHARHYLRLSDEILHSAYGALHSHARLQRMASELDNVRLALAWCDEHREIDALLGMSSVFWALWHARGLYREGRALVERALAQSSPRASVARILALDGVGIMAVFQGDYAQAATFIHEERVLAQELGDPNLIGLALTNEGLLISRHGEYGRAETLFTEAERLARAGADVELKGWAHLWIGDMALVQAHFDQAAAHYAEALLVFQAADLDWGLVDVNAGLGGVNYCTGNHFQAAAYYWESLDRARDLGVEILAVGSLLGLAGVAAESGSAERGARLFGAAEGIAASFGAPIFPRDHPARDRALTALTALLGEDHLVASRATGGILTLEQAVAEARLVTERVAGLST